MPGSAIVFGVDEGYVLPLSVALRSLAANSAPVLAHAEVVVIYEHLAPESIRRLRCHGAGLGTRLRLAPWKLRDEGYETPPLGTRANNLRLFLEPALPDHDRALYLDGDILVLGDLSPLLATDLGGLPLGAVRDMFQPTYGAGSLVMPGWRALDLPADREYFNSGVMLFDLGTCRRERLFERAVRFLETHPEHTRIPDQDALNWAADDRWLRLERTWNTAPMSAVVMNGCISYGMDEFVPLQSLLDDEPAARVMHFATHLKPWRSGYPVGSALRLYSRYLMEVRVADARAGLTTPP